MCAQVVHTFMRGCELIGRPTKQKFLLEAGELRGLFEGPTKQCWDPLRNRWFSAVSEPTSTISATSTGTKDCASSAPGEPVVLGGVHLAPVWEVVMDEVRPISDGRPLSFFMATRVR